MCNTAEIFSIEREVKSAASEASSLFKDNPTSEALRA
jgi:hypothetical protein